MKNKLEEQMTEMMDSASLKELMPDFDKDALWSELEPVVIVTRKKALLPLKWMSYAAAILLIIAATYIIKQSAKNGSEPSDIAFVPNTTSATKTTNNTQQPTIDKEPIHPIKQQEIIATASSKKTVPLKTISNTNADNQNLEQPQIQDSNPGPAITGIPVRETPVVASVARKKVVHYLDIDDAPVNAESAVAEASFIQMKFKYPEPSNMNESGKPIKNLFIALAR